jgi:hypothetical protein
MSEGLSPDPLALSPWARIRAHWPLLAIISGAVLLVVGASWLGTRPTAHPAAKHLTGRILALRYVTRKYSPLVFADVGITRGQTYTVAIRREDFLQCHIGDPAALIQTGASVEIAKTPFCK